jgi:hypothetical protein
MGGAFGAMFGVAFGVSAWRDLQPQAGDNPSAGVVLVCLALLACFLAGRRIGPRARQAPTINVARATASAQATQAVQVNVQVPHPYNPALDLDRLDSVPWRVHDDSVQRRQDRAIEEAPELLDELDPVEILELEESGVDLEKYARELAEADE